MSNAAVSRIQLLSKPLLEKEGETRRGGEGEIKSFPPLSPSPTLPLFSVMHVTHPSARHAHRTP